MLLLQVQCGACGLNLQAASRVFLLRPQWNPAVEKQAVGRAARSGQMRTVRVVRLVARGTVEEARARRRDAKLSTIAELLGEGVRATYLKPDGCTTVFSEEN